MAHSLTDEELIAALESRGTYMVQMRTGTTPVSAPAGNPKAGNLSNFGIPPPSHTTSPHGPTIDTAWPSKHAQPPPKLNLQDVLQSSAGRGARFKASTPYTPTAPAGRGAPFIPHTPGPTDSADHSGHYRLATPSVPKVPFFSGDDRKDDALYREWRFEVRCLTHDPDVSPSILVQAIRRSLRGTARTMLMSLGEDVTAAAIISKLDSNYGDMSSNSQVMQEFYNCYQKPDESVTTFGCRLEVLLQIAVENGHLVNSDKDDLLRNKFWTSLSSDEIRFQTRHKFDSLKNYDALLREIRLVEKEMVVNAAHRSAASSSSASSSSSSSFKKATHQPVVAGSHETELEKRIDQKLEGLEKKIYSTIDEKFNQILQRLDNQPANVAAVKDSNSNSYNNNNNAGSNRPFNRRPYNNRQNNRGNGRPYYNNQGSRQFQDPLNR